MERTNRTISREIARDKNYYDSLWQQTGGKEHPHIAEKTEIILDIIPQDVKTVVDVGCGDGAITNVLAERHKIIGGDISLDGLKNLSARVHPVLANAANLPFQDVSADMVFSSEMLEHLPDSDFNRAVSEMKRISKKYILITVPNNEKLRKRYTKCKNCAYEFHIYRHFRSFSLKKLARHFDGYTVRFSTLCGAPDEPSFDTISYLRNKLANAYFFVDTVTILCPNCGKEAAPFKAGLLSRMIGRGLYWLECSLNYALNYKPAPDWLVVLFEKNST